MRKTTILSIFISMNLLAHGAIADSASPLEMPNKDLSLVHIYTDKGRLDYRNGKLVNSEEEYDFVQYNQVTGHVEKREGKLFPRDVFSIHDPRNGKALFSVVPRKVVVFYDENGKIRETCSLDKLGRIGLLCGHFGSVKIGDRCNASNFDPSRYFSGCFSEVLDQSKNPEIMMALEDELKKLGLGSPDQLLGETDAADRSKSRVLTKNAASNTSSKYPEEGSITLGNAH